MDAAEQTTQLLDLVLSDWAGRQSTRLQKVPSSTTVGQVVDDAVRSLGLPFQDLYQAVVRGREVERTDTLDELGIETDSEIDIVPEVSAGRS